MSRASICRRSTACLVVLALAAVLALPAAALPGGVRGEGSWNLLSAFAAWLEDWFTPRTGPEAGRPGGREVQKVGPDMDPNGNPLPPTNHGEVGPGMDPDG